MLTQDKADFPPLVFQIVTRACDQDAYLQGAQETDFLLFFSFFFFVLVAESVLVWILLEWFTEV